MKRGSGHTNWGSLILSGGNLRKLLEGHYRGTFCYMKRNKGNGVPKKLVHND